MLIRLVIESPGQIRTGNQPFRQTPPNLGRTWSMDIGLKYETVSLCLYNLLHPGSPDAGLPGVSAVPGRRSDNQAAQRIWDSLWTISRQHLLWGWMSCTQFKDYCGDWEYSDRRARVKDLAAKVHWDALTHFVYVSDKPRHSDCFDC